MKMIVAIIRADRLDAVRQTLDDADVCVMSVSQVVGYGYEPGRRQIYRSGAVESRLPKLRVEIAANDFQVDEIVDAVIRSARSGQVGDGKVFVLGLEQCVRIRDGETGSAATGTPQELPLSRREPGVHNKPWVPIWSKGKKELTGTSAT
ncbi:MAG: P-II family nitrogen regulator [Gemmataceae bacterium]